MSILSAIDVWNDYLNLNLEVEGTIQESLPDSLVVPIFISWEEGTLSFADQCESMLDFAVKTGMYMEEFPRRGVFALGAVASYVSSKAASVIPKVYARHDMVEVVYPGTIIALTKEGQVNKDWLKDKKESRAKEGGVAFMFDVGTGDWHASLNEEVYAGTDVADEIISHLGVKDVQSTLMRLVSSRTGDDFKDAELYGTR